MIKTILPEDAIDAGLIQGEEREVLDFLIGCFDSDWELYIKPYINGTIVDFIIVKGGNKFIHIKVSRLKEISKYFYCKKRKKLFFFNRRGEQVFDDMNPVKELDNENYKIRDLPFLNNRVNDSNLISILLFTQTKASEFQDKDRDLLNDLKISTGTYSINISKYMTSIFDVLDFKKLVKSFETTNFKNDPNIMDSIRPWLIHPDHSRMNYKELPLDSRQRGIVFSKNEKLHRKIKGPAGSGKSLVLCAKANYLSNSKTVLILTFNITIFSYLIDFVKRKIKNQDNEYFTPKMINITAMHFHGFWKEFCHMHGQEKEYFNNPLQSDIAVEKVIKNLDKYGDKYKKYDAILVDEAQDMQDSSWWNLFRKYFLNDGGEMLLIADSSQDIYGRNKLDDLSLSGCGLSPNWIRLEGNHRLPKAFIPYLKSFKELFSIDTDLPYISEKESSDELLLNLRWVQVTKAALEKFDENITEIILNEFNIMGERFANNSYSDVYILGTLKQELNKIEKAFTEMKIEAISTYSSNKKKERLKKIFFSKNSAKVKITTIHSMKGLESKNLILFIDYNSMTKNDTSLKLIYTGLSRLKKSDSGSYLTVICTHPRFKKYGEKWPSYDLVNLQ